MAPRSFLSGFKGTEEIEKAVTVIGWIAINHARVEENLDYLIWQLDAFEMAGRRSHRALSAEDLQARLRKLRRAAKWSPIKNRVKNVGEVLSRGRVATRLRELADGLRFSTEWTGFGERIRELSDRRDEAAHSAVAWSAGRVVRTTGGSLDGDTSTLDLVRDQQLANDLGTLGTGLGQFTTALGVALPFASGDQIITFPPVKFTLDMNAINKSADSDVLRKTAMRLYGNDWHENLARVLNRHPEKLAGEVSTGLVVEWASGKKRPPLWVLTALSDLLVAHLDSDDEHEADFRMLFEAVKVRIERALEEGWDGSSGVRISVVGPEAGLLTEMINSRPTEPLTLGPGVKIIWRVPLGKDAQGLSVIDVVIFLGETVVPSVVGSLIAEWVMSKFRGRAERLIINKTECNFDEGKITKVVEESIYYERK